MFKMCQNPGHKKGYQRITTKKIKDMTPNNLKIGVTPFVLNYNLFKIRHGTLHGTSTLGQRKYWTVSKIFKDRQTMKGASIC